MALSMGEQAAAPDDMHGRGTHRTPFWPKTIRYCHLYVVYYPPRARALFSMVPLFSNFPFYVFQFLLFHFSFFRVVLS